jgi:Na+-transporting NADH:ubiquinone oxidoreductase subunit F
MPKITFNASGKAIDAEEGTWMYDVCQDAGSGVPFACKAGACGTCATEVLDGIEHCGDAGAREVRTLTAHALDPRRFRLPCLLEVSAGDVTFGAPVLGAKKAAAVATHEAVVESFRPLNLTVAEVRFFVESSKFEFKPGQYMIFHVPGDGKTVHRSYSISTPPSDRGHFEVCVRAVSGGFGSNYMHRLRPGMKLKVEGPVGEFVLREESKKDIVMVATGTGIAPIRSMLMHMLDTPGRRKIRLFFGLRHESDLFYTDLMRGLAAHNPEFEYHFVLSSPDPARWAGERGRVNDLIERHLPPDAAAKSEAYLCGSAAMIESARAALVAKGMAPDDVMHENFY